MPRGNRVLFLRDLHCETVVDPEDGTARKTGYEKGTVHNFPTHIAKALINKGYAELYHAPRKAK